MRSDTGLVEPVFHYDRTHVGGIDAPAQSHQTVRVIVDPHLRRVVESVHDDHGQLLGIDVVAVPEDDNASRAEFGHGQSTVFRLVRLRDARPVEARLESLFPQVVGCGNLGTPFVQPIGRVVPRPGDRRSDTREPDDQGDGYAHRLEKPSQ